MSKNETIKVIDIAVWTLLTIGGLNWGLIGFLNYDLVAAIFGPMSALSRIVYALVGLAAIYEITQLKSISRRWHMHFHTPANA
jgi:uncharacterized membrane protein YuzA (DUF378 family)